MSKCNMSKREKRFVIGLALLTIPLMLMFPLAMFVHKNSPDTLNVMLGILVSTSFVGATICGFNDDSSRLPTLKPIPRRYNRFELKHMNIAFKNRNRKRKNKNEY